MHDSIKKALRVIYIWKYNKESNLYFIYAKKRLEYQIMLRHLTKNGY